MELNKEIMKKIRLAHCICRSAVSWCTESGYCDQHSTGSARLPLPVHHRLWNCLYPERPDEIH